MMAMRPEAILFDLDGTLVDSAPDLALAINEMLMAVGKEPHPEAAILEWVGNGIERLCRRALVGAMTGEPDEALFHRAYPIFLERYALCNGRHSVLYPGALEALTQLRQEGFPLGCVTNKAARYALPLLEALHIRPYFGAVVCGDTAETRKPSPAPLQHAARTLGVDPLRCLMVGDSVNDVQAARAAGCAVIGLRYGYNHGVDIARSAPDHVADSLAEVTGFLPAI